MRRPTRPSLRRQVVLASEARFGASQVQPIAMSAKGSPTTTTTMHLKRLLSQTVRPDTPNNMRQHSAHTYGDRATPEFQTDDARRSATFAMLYIRGNG